MLLNHSHYSKQSLQIENVWWHPFCKLKMALHKESLLKMEVNIFRKEATTTTVSNVDLARLES